MADLVTPPSLLGPASFTNATSSGGGFIDAPTVTSGSQLSLSPTSPLSSTGGGILFLSTGTTIPHPQNHNNGQQMSCIEDDSPSHNNNNCAPHHHNRNGFSATPTSGGAAVLHHTRHHSHPLLLASSGSSDTGGMTANKSYVDSSAAPEMAVANNGSAPVVAALPSSLSTTMDILNLDFVNGNSSFCNNINNGGGVGTPSPLSCWPQCGSDSHSKIEQLVINTPGNNSSACTLISSDDHREAPVGVTGNCSLGDSSTSAKFPGEIPESVMKYLLTKTDSVDSAKSVHSSSGNSPTASTNSVPSTSAEHNKRLQEILVDLDTLQSTSEIAKVLENFNAILERIEQEDDKEALAGLEALATPLSPSVLQGPSGAVTSSTSRIKNSVETLADLLLSGCGDEEDEDLLIIIDENDTESLQSGPPPLSTRGGRGIENGVFLEEEVRNVEDDELDDDGDDDVGSLVEIEPDLGDLDQEEGYESDRPIVRASMRKLRPVKLLPMPSTSHHSSCSVNAFTTPPPTPVTPRASSPVDPHLGLGTTLNSPIGNNIVVASLINNLNSTSSPQNSTAGNNGNANILESSTHHRTVSASANCATASTSSTVNSSFVPTLEVMHVASSGGDASCRSHSRNQSNSSQIIQFHQNPVTLTTNPAGFVEVSIGPSSVPNQAGGILGSSGSTGNASTSSNTTGEARNNGTSDSCGNHTSSTSTTQPDNSRTATDSPATGDAANTGGAPSAGNSTPNESNGNGGRTRPRAPQAPSQSQQRRAPTVLRVPSGRWPHRLSSVLAVVGCTLGLNNICRFSLLSVQYGANFILQFIFLSLVFGIPLLTFHMSIGQYLSSGIIDMWKISPIFQGIGVGLVISQAMIGIYTTVGVSWIFIYFRDSFITRQDQYRWGKCVREFGDCDPQNSAYNTTLHMFNKTVPDYFNAVVLQRTSPEYPESAYVPSSLKFTVAFNLAVVWMLVFVSLSKGLKSYGKVVHGFVLAPVAALFVLAFKMVGLVQAGGSIFGQTKWSDFFFSTQTWVAAAREAFFTWGLLGACVMQITAHNRHSHSLKSDSLIVIMVTMVVLMLSAFIGNACYSVLTAPNAIAPNSQFSYVPSSFESQATYRFLETTDSEESVTDMYDHHHVSFLMGVRVIKQGSDFHQRSGYQVLRLATELFPASMAVLSQTTGMSSFWTVLFYFAFVLFGIAQQIAIWHCVIKGIIAAKGKVLRSWETTITFFVCGLGFVLGLPLCTETGIFIEYFMDYAIGSGWWIMVLYLLELIAVFIVRGAPYCGENIVTVLITGRSRLNAVLAPLISFIWNVIMPVAILVLSIASFKSGNIRELYDWNPKHGYRFWPSWTREVGSLIQLVPILAVPFVAILQSCRYLSSGPPDLFDRMQQLYRPNSQGIFGNSHSGSFHENGGNDSSSSRNGSSSRGPEDPPPKYTPPPSYSTATGAKIAKFLRNSFRRSLRRLSSPGGPSTSTSSPDNVPPPPNYASVILEINSQRVHQSSSCSQSTSSAARNLLNPIMVPPPAYDERTMSEPNAYAGVKCVGMNPGELLGSKLYQVQLSQTLGRSLGEGSKERASLRRIASEITSRDIARMLRASLRRRNKDSPEASTSAAAATSASAYSTNSSPGNGVIVRIPASSNIVDSSGTPCEYTFGPNSMEKVECDLEMLYGFGHPPDSQPPVLGASSSAMAGHSRQSSASSAFGFNFGFNRARNRNSNDSQLALITSGVFDDVNGNGLIGVLADGEMEIDQFTHLNLPRRDSLSVLDLGQQGNANPTFRIHNANITNPTSSSSREDRVEQRAADSEA